MLEALKKKTLSSEKEVLMFRPARIRKISSSLCSIPVIILALSWVVSAQPLGSLDGLVKSSRGAPIPGAVVSYGRLAPASPRAAAAMVPPVVTTVTDANGSFSIRNLTAATYLVCVAVKGGAYLNPCHWSDSPFTFTVAAGQAIHGAVIRIEPAQQVTVAISDPSGAFASAGKGLGAHLLLGARAPSGALLPARLAASSASGRTYHLTVPFDSPTDVFIAPGAFALADDSGNPVPKGGKAMKITAASGGAPPALSFVVKGVH
jgi:hypothetical protein